MRGPIVGRMFQRMERFLLGLPLDRRVFISEGSREVARKLGLARDEDVVLEPGISLADYRSAPDKHDVVFSGKLDVRKGIDSVLQAATRLPHVPFRIVGWGERFDEIAQALPANVQMERFRDRNHLAEVLGRARIFLFPSKAETFGLVVAEAMASGCAVVSTLPIPFEGVHLREPDAESVTDAVRRLWSDPDACHAAGAANERAAQRYSWPHHVEQLEGIYLELLRQHSKNTRS
jgi:glycosyltransferase involved in cell wall biosynthesis